MAIFTLFSFCKLFLFLHWNYDQVLRSCSKWSAGIDGFEDSIYRAYVNAIKAAEHYVYIENQFFITNSGQAASTPSNSNVEQAFSMPQIAAEAGAYVQEIFNMAAPNVGSSVGADIVKNRIGQALVDRITRAHRYEASQSSDGILISWFLYVTRENS